MSDAGRCNKIYRIGMRLPRELKIAISHPGRTGGDSQNNTERERERERDCVPHYDTVSVDSINTWRVNPQRSLQVNVKRPLNEFENRELFACHIPSASVASHVSH